MRLKGIRYLFLTLLILSALSCQGALFTTLADIFHNQTAVPVPTVIADDVRVTGDLSGGLPGCTAREVARRLTTLFDAINRGDHNIINDFFRGHDEHNFQWYSMTAVSANGTGNPPKDHFVAYKLDDLAAYFETRFQNHEFLHLIAVQVNGWEGTLVNFGPIIFMRSADDLQHNSGRIEYKGIGKGALNCEAQTFVALSLAIDVP